MLILVLMTQKNLARMNVKKIPLIPPLPLPFCPTSELWGEGNIC